MKKAVNFMIRCAMVAPVFYVLNEDMDRWYLNVLALIYGAFMTIVLPRLRRAK